MLTSIKTKNQDKIDVEFCLILVMSNWERNNYMKEETVPAIALNGAY